MDSISPRRYLENHHHHQHQTLLPSPHHNNNNTLSSNGSNSNSSSTNSNNGHHHSQQLPPLSPTPLTPTPAPAPTPYPPKPITRSESTTSYPTTFVQADSSSFKQVVQMLTGSSETAKQASSTYSSNPTKPGHIHNPTSSDIVPPPSKNHHMIPPIKTMPTKQHQSGFKLYERRNNLNKSLNINPLLPSVFSSTSNHPSSVSGFSPLKPAEVLSPSILEFPALVLSPVTPLIPDPFDRSGSAVTGHRYADNGSGNGSPVLDTEAEEKAIKEKSFFLHPSPATTPRDTEPRLLPLFPTTSPKASGASSSSS